MGIVPTSQIYIDNTNNKFFKLWRLRTNIIYCKMNNIWKDIIKDASTTTSIKFTSDQMSRIINAYNKIDYIDHAIVANSKSVDYAYPYNTNLAALYSMKGFVDAKGNVLSTTTAEPLNGTISSFAYVLSNKSLIFDFE